ncbi:bacillithiol system protein YtxJ [Bacillus mesophilus]|nr:bacillithiol system protein YtxJ [Bacillus mesophilus]
MKTRVSTIEQFENIKVSTSEFLVIKHSLTCPVSTAAFDEYEKFVNDHADVPTFYLYVQEERDLSNYIAEKHEIKHESPQALFFKNGEVVWNASHWKITNRSLTEAIR